MASNLGSVFVEISLDDKIYKQKLSETLTSTEATAKGIETSWKVLGTKNDASFDAQRRSYENAMTLIKSSTTATAADIIRAEEAKNAKIKALNEQQYGAHVSWIDKLKTNWLGMTAVATAVFYGIKNIVAEPISAYMEAESALMKLGLAMKNQGDYSITALNDLVEFSEQMQRTTVIEDDLAKAVMGTLKSFGMTNEEVKRSTMAAADMATFTGKSIETVSELLGKAYAGNTAALSRYGIVIDDSIPKSERFAAVLAQLEQRFGGSAQANLNTYAGQWQQLKNQWQDVQEFMGLVFLKTIQAIAFSIGMVGAGFWKTVDVILSSLSWLSGKLQAFADFVGLKTVANGIGVVTDALAMGAKNAQEAADAAIKNADANYKNMVSFNNVTTAIDKMGVAGTKAQYVNDETTKATISNINKVQERQIVAFKVNTDLELKSVDIKEMSCDEKARMERDLYEDIRGYESSAYAASLVLIESQVKKFREAKISEVAIQAWVSQEQEKAYIKMAEKGDDWRAGVTAGLLKLKENMMTWGKASSEIVTTFASSASSSMSNLFFDAVKGNLGSLKDYFSSVWDALLRKFADICSQMLVEWALVRSGLAEEFGFNISSPKTVTGMTAGVTGSGAVTDAAGVTTFMGMGSAAGTYGASAMPSTIGVVTPYFTAGAAGYVGGSALAEAIFGSGSGTGGGIGGSIGAMAGYTWGGPVGGAIGGVVGSLIGGFIDSLFGSNAGFGSKTTAQSEGVYGGMPVFGKWNELSGAKGPADAEVTKAFMDDSYAAIAYTYQKIADYANTLDDAHKTALAEGLASMKIQYLPQYTDVTLGPDIFITRENVGLLEGYVKSIPGFILSQVNPVVEYLTGNVVSAKSGLDYVPYDNFLINAHKGERVQTADERSNLAGEIKSLRAEQRETNRRVMKIANNFNTIISRWEYNGLPATRT